MYELLYRWGLTPWVAAGRAQSALVERLLDREEAWHGSTVGRTLVDLGCGTGEHSLAAAKRGWAVVGLGRPDVLPLGAAMGTPAASMMASVAGWFGQRTPTVSSPPVVRRGTISRRGRIMVSGPGQNFSASR